MIGRASEAVSCAERPTGQVCGSVSVSVQWSVAQ